MIQFLKNHNSGRIAIFFPKNKNCDFCLNFPGYTGDSSTHNTFIKYAITNNIGVICVNVIYGESVRQMRENSEILLNDLESNGFQTKKIKFIRGTSFGYYLSLPWIKKTNDTLEKIAFITPCHGKQLPYAAKKMGATVYFDDKFENVSMDNIKKRIIVLENDEMIPSGHEVFERNEKTIIIQNCDHFSAGDTVEATVDIVDWFIGKKATTSLN